MYASLLCVLALSFAVDSSKILIYVGNLPMGSHVRVSNFLGNSLVQHGHEVWFLIPDTFYDRRIKEDKGKVFSYITMPVNFTAEEVDRANNDFLDKSMNGETTSLYNSLKTLLSNEQKRGEAKRFKHVLEAMVVACDILLNDDALISKIRKEKFDFLIGDSLMPCHHLLSKRILTSYATLDVPPVLPALISKIRVPSNPAYVPEGFSHLTDEMNFFQRLLNFLMAQAVPLAMDIFLHNPLLAIETKDNDIKDVLKSSQENLFSSVDIWFGVNCHPAIEFPRPVTIDMLCTRGMLSTPSNQILDIQLLSFVQSARHGVVLISMGSLVNMSSGDLLETLAAAFSRLPYSVVWKYNSKFPPMRLGNNTKLMNWIPQNDLLGNKQIRSLF
ncbi:2-hydroxyacylsphingosine 1-beta-galactosyltransferase-like [Anneissia japonica]|uniref:2-hydroxyacylsphingosine 1-beta-galactosyltransferase-like n=1 Tax=Anneissia japonica TaxID=1529436 RepID=UPI001425B59E|nr:2-hydroxyacylsphingosine 1-beta-galactosyltransferase-like [Anneissia japonica]